MVVKAYNVLRYEFSHHKLLTAPVPEAYLKAASELIVFMLVVGWISTGASAFNNNIVLNTIHGYPTVWEGVDYHPASALASIIYGCAQFLIVRFGMLDMRRSWSHKHSMSRMTLRFSLVSDVLLLVSCTVLPVTFVVNSDESQWAHTLPYLFFVLSHMMVVAANFNEAPENNWAEHMTSQAFLAVYIGVSLMLVVLQIVNMVLYDSHLPCVYWGFTFVLDYLWVVCLLLTSIMLPDGGPIEATFFGSPN